VYTILTLPLEDQLLKLALLTSVRYLIRAPWRFFPDIWCLHVPDGDGDLDLIWLLSSAPQRLQYAIQNSSVRSWAVTTRPESINGTVGVPCDIDRNGKIGSLAVMFMPLKFAIGT
jgi:hypothetical protein